MTAVPTTAAPRPRRALWAALGVVATLNLAALVVYVGAQWGPQDSGVAACTAMGQLTRPAYLRTPDAPDARVLRGDFARSRYGDLRDAGTHFVDLAIQLAPGPVYDGTAAALAPWVAGQLLDSYSRLSGACVNHGVPIPPLLSVQS